MDPLDKLHQESDSSLILANEAQKRGNKIFIYQTDQLSLINDQVFALLNPLKLIKKKNKYQSRYRSLNNFEPGFTAYLSKSFSPSSFRTYSSMKKFPVHSLEFFDKIT